MSITGIKFCIAGVEFCTMGIDFFTTRIDFLITGVEFFITGVESSNAKPSLAHRIRLWLMARSWLAHALRMASARTMIDDASFIKFCILFKSESLQRPQQQHRKVGVVLNHGREMFYFRSCILHHGSRILHYGSRVLYFVSRKASKGFQRVLKIK